MEQEGSIVCKLTSKEKFVEVAKEEKHEENKG